MVCQVSQDIFAVTVLLLTMDGHVFTFTLDNEQVIWYYSFH